MNIIKINSTFQNDDKVIKGCTMEWVEIHYESKQATCTLYV